MHDDTVVALMSHWSVANPDRVLRGRQCRSLSHRWCRAILVSAVYHADTAGRDDLPEALAHLCERFQLVAIYAFGSRAREMMDRVAGRVASESRPDSDLDIGVLPERSVRLSVREKVDLAIALEDLFGVQRVDLVTLPEAGPFLARDIVVGELLCARDLRAEARYQLYALRRAADLVPYARQELDRWLAGESVVR
jgi:uncharacterized protein